MGKLDESINLINFSDISSEESCWPTWKLNKRIIIYFSFCAWTIIPRRMWISGTEDNMPSLLCNL